MRSYYSPLSDGSYQVNAYSLSRKSGVQRSEYTAYAGTANEPAQTEDALIPPISTDVDVHKVYNTVFNKDRISLSIPCYNMMTIYKVHLSIANSLGNKAILGIFDDEYIFASFKLCDNDTAYTEGEYDLLFSWEGSDSDISVVSTAASINTDLDVIDINGIHPFLHNGILYYKIANEQSEGNFKFIPYILNRYPVMNDDNSANPSMIHFRISGIDDAGLAQLTVETYPLMYVTPSE